MSTISIKFLARDLGITSRALIERCRVEGLWVQNSITKLTPRQAETVRMWFRPDTSTAESSSRARAENGASGTVATHDHSETPKVDRTFPIATTDGEPLSEIIIRERR